MTPAIATVHRGELASHVAPNIVTVPGHALLAVVQECDDHDIGREDGGWHSVMIHDRAQSVVQSAPVEHQAPGYETGQRDGAMERVAAKHGEPRVEVGHLDTQRKRRILSYGSIWIITIYKWATWT